MGVKHLSPAGVASGLYAALMNVIFLAQRIGMPLALLKSYGVPSEIAFEHDGWWPLGPATEIGSLLTVKRSGSMKMKTPLSPASRRPLLKHFEQTVFRFSSVFLRFALGLSFLSAVADRFGLWGQFGQPNVAWGNFSRFVEYTGRLNSYLPPRMTLTLAVISTGAEILFGLLLLVGWHTRTAALLSGILLMAFGLAMALALGAKAPLDFSVFSAAGGALLLAGCERFPFSVDGLLLLRSR